MPTRRQTLATLAAVAALPSALRAGEITAHDFAFPGIEGGLVRLADWVGQPVLVVNTASRCGFTYQYEGMQALYDRYRARGLVVVGVPSNDFRQELASEDKVKEFCETTYGIDFPMTGITPVKGASAHPFYVWAKSALGEGKAPRWNFHKYLVGPDGRLAGAWGSTVEPTSPAVIAEIEKMLPES